MILDIFIGILVIAVLIYTYIRLKSEEEAYLPIKLIGFYILGTFRFSLNKLAIPLGFIIFLLFFRPTRNIKAKKACAYVGIAVFVVSISAPAVSNAFFERTRFIESNSQNFYHLELRKDFDTISSRLGIKGSIRLNDLRMDYDNVGKIKNLQYEIVSQVVNGFELYNVSHEQDSKNYSVSPVKTDSWIQYPRLPNAAHFFEMIEKISTSDLKTKKSWDYYSISYSHMNVDKNMNRDNKIYRFINNKPVLIPDKDLPHEGDCLLLVGMAKTSSNSYEGKEYVFYMLN